MITTAAAETLNALAVSAARLATLTGKTPAYPMMMNTIIDHGFDTQNPQTKDNRWDLNELRRLYQPNPSDLK